MTPTDACGVLLDACTQAVNQPAACSTRGSPDIATGCSRCRVLSLSQLCAHQVQQKMHIVRYPTQLWSPATRASVVTGLCSRQVGQPLCRSRDPATSAPTASASVTPHTHTHQHHRAQGHVWHRLCQSRIDTQQCGQDHIPAHVRAMRMRHGAVAATNSVNPIVAVTMKPAEHATFSLTTSAPGV